MSTNRLPDSKTLILNVLKTFEKEERRNRPVVSFAKPLQRAVKTLRISRFVINRLTKQSTCSDKPASKKAKTTSSEAKEGATSVDKKK